MTEGRNALQSNLTDDLYCYACGEPWSIPDHVEVWWEDDDPRMKLHCSRTAQQPMSEESGEAMSDTTPVIPSEIPTTKDGWRQRAIGLKLRLSAAEAQNAALQERIDRTLEALNTRSPFFVELRELLSPTQETDLPGPDDVRGILKRTQETDPDAT